MKYTGERMIPELSDTWTFWQDLHRCRLAVQHVKGKEVLNLACDER